MACPTWRHHGPQGAVFVHGAVGSDRCQVQSSFGVTLWQLMSYGAQPGLVSWLMTNPASNTLTARSANHQMQNYAPAQDQSALERARQYMMCPSSPNAHRAKVLGTVTFLFGELNQAAEVQKCI